MNKKIIKEIVDYLRNSLIEEDFMFEYDGENAMQDENDSSWINFISIAEFDPNNEELNPFFNFNKNNADKEDLEEINSFYEQGIPNYVVRVINRAGYDDNGDGILERVLDLVDGTQLYFNITEDKKTGEIEINSLWSELWYGNQPDYYGGPIPEAKEWCEEIGKLVYEQLDCPFPNRKVVDNPSPGYPPYVDSVKIIENPIQGIEDKN